MTHTSSHSPLLHHRWHLSLSLIAPNVTSSCCLLPIEFSHDQRETPPCLAQHAAMMNSKYWTTVWWRLSSTLGPLPRMNGPPSCQSICTRRRHITICKPMQIRVRPTVHCAKQVKWHVSNQHLICQHPFGKLPGPQRLQTVSNKLHLHLQLLDLWSRTTAQSSQQTSAARVSLYPITHMCDALSAAHQSPLHQFNHVTNHKRTSLLFDPHHPVHHDLCHSLQMSTWQPLACGQLNHLNMTHHRLLCHSNQWLKGLSTLLQAQALLSYRCNSLTHYLLSSLAIHLCHATAYQRNQTHQVPQPCATLHLTILFSIQCQSHQQKLLIHHVQYLHMSKKEILQASLKIEATTVKNN